MKILITGGCGFIGSNLSKALVDEGYTVDIVDDLSLGTIDAVSDKGLDFRVCPPDMIKNFPESARENKVLIFTSDFTNEAMLSSIKDGKYDSVVHLAANTDDIYMHSKPVECCENNLFKSVALFNACSDSDTRIILNCFPRKIFEPGCELNRMSFLEIHSAFCEIYAQKFSQTYGLDYSAVRYSNLPGIEQKLTANYIKDVVYNNISLIGSRFARREIEIR